MKAHHERPGFETRLFQGLARFVVRRKIWILIAAAVIVLASMALSGRIRFVTEVKDLLPQNNEVVKNFNFIYDRFSDTSSIIVTVEGPSREVTISAAERVADAIRADKSMSALVNAIQMSPDKEFLRKWMLLTQDSGDIETTLSLFDGLNLLPFLRSLNDNFETTYIDDPEQEAGLDSPSDAYAMLGYMDQIEEFAMALRAYLADDALPQMTEPELQDRGARLADFLLFGSDYMFSPDNEMLLFTIYTKFGVEETKTLSGFMTSLKQKFSETETALPGVEIGYTGALAEAYDEAGALGFDLLVPSGVAMVLILLLFLFSIRRIRYVIFTLVSLVVGIVVDMGFVGATIGELNMVTSTFGVLLIGLGVDFGLHIISSFGDLREKGADVQEALSRTFLSSGKAVAYGALTTAVAFYTLAFSSSKAISQFGIVAGTGILTVLVSMFILLPALLSLFCGIRRSAKGRRILGYAFLARTGVWSARFRIPVLIVFAALSVLLGLNIGQNQVEFGSENIGAKNSPSAVYRTKILEKFDMSPDTSMVALSSIQEVSDVAGRLKDERDVAVVTSIADFLRPEPEQQVSLARIRGYRDSWSPSWRQFSYDEQSYQELLYELQRLEWNMIEIGDISVTALGEGNVVQRKRDRMIREVLGAEVGAAGSEVFQNVISLLESNPGQFGPRLARIDRAFAGQMEQTARNALGVDRPMQVEDIPYSLRASLVSDDGKLFMITINPTASVDSSEGYLTFATRMHMISPAITGTSQIFAAFTSEIIREIARSSVYVGIAIILIVLVGFRSLKYTAMAIGALGIAGVIMFGIFPLVGIKINAINAMVFPLIIGLGIDYFIHVITSYRQNGDLGEALLHSGKPVLLSGLTTMLGFGSLALAGSHAGAQSLGSVLFIGTACALLASFTLLPALLSVGKRVKRTPLGTLVGRVVDCIWK